ncbi:hypothetical protein [Psychrobacter sp. I-STPA10]|uniref:hypothetical protein n=1 Tax=Psychrobacter sp. I-STPA10 TaxID=2585769 RepID=UPI001E59801C|nr:hypothetical protein [Psychrobacter sp. I-STPA10]
MTFADNQTGMTSINTIHSQQRIAASDNHTHSNTANTIVAITLADMLQQPMLVGLVGQVFLSLGSNHNPKQHLAYARGVLSELGQIRCSPELVNPDFTATKAQPKPDYTNQCLLLSLSAAVSTAEFVAMMAQIEADCQRQRQSSSMPPVLSKSTVSKSVVSSNNGSNLASSQQDSLKQANTDASVNANAKALKLVTLDIDILAIQPVQQNIWYRLSERYPFKAHELYGIHALKMAQKLL